MSGMITKGFISFDFLKFPDGRRLVTQVDATDEEIAALIEKHKDDPLWDIRYKKCQK